MSIFRQVAAFWPEFVARLSARSDREPIADMPALLEFVASRSAFVSQKTLYGYLKTRMGTRYPTVFEDDQMIASVNIAKLHVYAACARDLSIFCAAVVGKNTNTDDEKILELARTAYDHAITENIDASIDADQIRDWSVGFEGRLADTPWNTLPAKPETGIESPSALYKWAPIAPELKKMDVEVVRNSVRFAWHEVRAQFRERCDGLAIVKSIS